MSTAKREEARRRLTADTFGELDASERADLKALLEQDEELQLDARELSSVHALLNEALRAAPERELTGLQRLRILWRSWRPFGRPKGVLVMPLTTAAALLALWTAAEEEVPQRAAPPVPAATVAAEDESEALHSPVEDTSSRRWRPSSPRSANRGGGVYKPDSARGREEPEADVMAEPDPQAPVASRRETAPETFEPFARRQGSSAPRAAKPNLSRKPPTRTAPPRRQQLQPPARVNPFDSASRSSKKRPLRLPADENYDRFLSADAFPQSTFSIDVDTASYGRMRADVRSAQLPYGGTRIEELVNYFHYEYPRPRGRHPVSITVDAAQAPWARQNGLVRIGLRAATPPRNDHGSNVVFLIDVSGSMADANKLPLLKRAMVMLVDELGARDWVSIVVYAGRSAVLLEPTPATERELIKRTIRGLTSQGSTDGGKGILLAYELASQHFIPDGINRVFLATDGDFNVGISDPDDLEEFIQEKAESGVFLSALGFGRSVDGDRRLETLASKGNGNYAFIDDDVEAYRVLNLQLRSTMAVVAKDVKLQVEFNPDTVESYRLLGYDNRRLRRRDFEDDTKDAGDIGAGHTVTAFYEVRPVVGASSDDLLTVNLRYKPVDSSRSVLMTESVRNRFVGFNSAPRDFRFGAAVAAVGMWIRGYDETGTLQLEDAESWAGAAMGGPDAGERAAFVEMVAKVRELAEARDRYDDESEPPGRSRGDRYDCNPPWELRNGIKKIKPQCF